MPSTVAVLGLGAMGVPMAQAMAPTLTVRAFDPDPGRRRLAQEHGVSVHATAREAVAGAGVVLLAVRDASQVEQVLLASDHGVLEVLEHGAAVVLTSTVGIDAVRELDEAMARSGALLVDAPVSGGPVRAGDGDLVVLVAGSPQARERAGNVLSAIGSTVTVVGDRPGDGQALKTVNQLLCGVHIAAAAEALALARRLGLDLRLALDALTQGAAHSFMLQDRGERMVQLVEGADPEVLSTVGIFVKDLSIVAEASRSAAVPTPVASAAEHLFRIAARMGQDRADDSTVLNTLIDPSSR
ncbi:NAD(P)-dependent oxidoreductase [Ruania rhizosphaerae]|uniref:NAD(P)-dependent oxidoreductase n=1 Tax=Ruania rhizosphaerae TaxID=1840413 RepID=UPI001358C9A2|nr:NAD(P)-dependent oxidoreductase [Ruania rhizosphaerae]